ncbi:MAG: glucokinase [Rudaea sp.]
MILAGDIGGTKTLLALFEDGALRLERRYPSGEFASFDSVLGRLLDEAVAELGSRPAIDRGCLGVAGPVIGKRSDVTHLPWTLDADRLAARFGIERMALLNDFAASAHGIEALTPDDVVTLQAGAPLPSAPRVLVGAGTGLGVAHLFHDGTRYRVFASEGGHTGFAPRDERQVALWRTLHEAYDRVEAEHVVSGPGLERIYRHLSAAPLQASRDAVAGSTRDDAAAIVRAALEQGDALAGEALDLFVECYGAIAGDHALNLVARGGVYIAGGVAPKILARIVSGRFVAAFNDKGAFSELARSMPLHVVVNERLGLLGAARVAASL